MSNCIVCGVKLELAGTDNGLTCHTCERFIDEGEYYEEDNTAGYGEVTEDTAEVEIAKRYGG